ncbi:citryl-CoA lyase [Microbacterium sp. X-17]|uniref:citryl-CoA lyase n=1 Tax=Microbacterium sp. X-17 TaxID=3144404 RepID=UPI0031F5C827
MAEQYWESAVSRIDDSTVRIRGYDLEELIGGLTFTSAAYLLIRGALPTPNQTKMMDAVLTAVLDYALQKPGTVAARYVMSANPNVAASLASAVLAVGKNTLAPEDTARFAIDSYKRLTESNDDAVVVAARIVAEERAAKRRIPGLGHPVFKNVDPRAEKIKTLARELGFWGPQAEFYELIHTEFRRQSGRDWIPLNDIGVMALVLAEMGFTPDETTGIAIISTLPGVVAHLTEEQNSGRPIRIVAPEDVSYDTIVRDFESDKEVAGW